MAEEAKKPGFFGKIGEFFKGVKTEYSKIIFPSADTLKKQTVAVIVSSIFICLVMFVLDLIIKYLLGFIL